MSRARFSTDIHGIYQRIVHAGCATACSRRTIQTVTSLRQDTIRTVPNMVLGAIFMPMSERLRKAITTKVTRSECGSSGVKTVRQATDNCCHQMTGRLGEASATRAASDTAVGEVVSQHCQLGAVMKKKDEIFFLVSLLKVFDLDYMSDEDATTLRSLDVNNSEDVIRAVQVFLMPEWPTYPKTARDRLLNVLRKSVSDPTENFVELFDQVGLAFEDELTDRRAFMASMLTVIEGETVQDERGGNAISGQKRQSPDV